MMGVTVIECLGIVRRGHDGLIVPNGCREKNDCQRYEVIEVGGDILLVPR